MYRHVVTLNWTDVSEVRSASIIRAMNKIPGIKPSQKRHTHTKQKYKNTSIALMIEAVSTSETKVHFNVTTRRYILEDS
jgi:hypothetical protein